MRNVIVTGGSRGLGLALVRRLAADGYCAIAIARKSTCQLEAAMADAEQSPGSIRFVPFDLGDTQKIPQLVSRLQAEFQPLYGLINNAALGTDGALAMMPNPQIETLIRMNTLSPIILTK